MNLPTIFVTGLFAGGLTCLAVQGGLLAASISQQNDRGPFPVISFLLSRLAAYTLLGVLLGLLGSAAQLTLGTRVLMQFAVSIFMLGSALNMLNAHPIFRYFVIQPPKVLTRLVRNQSKQKSIIAPALLGAFTVVIPCGATQAMMAYAISTSSPITASGVMFTFILGTTPLFLLAGLAVKKMSSSLNANFTKFVAIAIIIIALININSAIALSGFKLDLAQLFSNTPQTAASSAPTVDQVTISFTQYGYNLEPSVANVAAGQDVKLTLVNKGGFGCIQAFTIPSLGVERIVAPGTTTQLTISAPNQKGPLAFMCSMGMYRGYINVI